MRRLERRLALLCAAAGILLIFAGGSLAVVEGGLTPRTSFTLVAGVALVIAYAILDPAAVSELLRSRRARFGTLSVLVSAVLVGILIAANVLASRSTQATDLTRSGLYTLSQKSVLVTRRLDADLVVTGFFRPDQQTPKRDAGTLLALYQQESPYVKVRFADPDQNSAQAVRLGVTIAGSIVLQYKSKAPVVLTLASQTESDVSGAILRLETSRAPVICWAAGDGERDLSDTNQATGYSAVSDQLKTSNYQVQTVLLSQQGVPATCDLLTVVGVLRPLSDSSVKAIQDYVAGGGGLLLAIDPWVSRDGKALASVNAIVKQYGVAFDGGLVIEGDPAHSATNDPTIPVASSYGESPVTKDLSGKYVFLPQPTSISGTASGGATAADLVTSTSRAFEITQARENLNRQAADRAGPFVLMQTLQAKQSNGKTSRVVLAGTSALAENRAMPPNAGGSNPDLMLASLDWLSAQEGLIAVGPKPPRSGPLSLSDQDLRFNQFVTVLVLPGVVLVIGLLVLVRRRRAPA
jgi:ABC-type uncharacterized transport system involved in gliding motility auxiliary subunit